VWHQRVVTSGESVCLVEFIQTALPVRQGYTPSTVSQTYHSEAEPECSCV
jgi:hypothetical protein